MSPTNPREAAFPARLSLKKRFKRYLFDRYFRWEADTLTAPPETIVNERFQRDATQMRLALINPGMLDWRNVRLFDYCIPRLPSDAPLLEIGSFAGLSLNNLVYLARKYGRPNAIFSVDNWSLGAHHGYRVTEEFEVEFDAYRPHVIETFRRNVQLFSADRLPHHLELNSDAFFNCWAAGEKLTDFFGRTVKLGGPISFAYIDGDHSYEQSRRDFDNVNRYLEPGGFIVFDDSADTARSPRGTIWGSNRTAREAASLPSYRVIDKSYHYCIQKIIG